ncbi:MAG: hypothetical protein J0G94_17240 [Sphingomonadales bacterium]|nr:hypothetical protein [Sphingomonadales bacterium]
MRHCFLAAALLAAGGPLRAQDIALEPLVDARLRYETASQQDLADDADALTARLRGGVQASSGPVSALVEGEGTLALINRYYDGLRGMAKRPLVADPQDIALYRAQLQYRSEALVLTGGRQRLAFDDERFVGNVAFRQNAQTFDAVKGEVLVFEGVKFDVAYAWSVRTIWGVDGAGARPRSIDGDNLFANLSAATPFGTVTGFAYLVDQDEAAVQGYRLSSQTYGGRLTGARQIGRGIKLGYVLSYARQSDYHRNPNRFAARYWLGEATLDVKALRLNAGYERLGASGGGALTSFQTPLGTNFKFQGWADKFLTTPPNGIGDLYLGGGYGWTRVGKIDAISVQAVWHDFRSDRLDQHYGSEIDLLATAKVRKASISARYARYQADAFGADTRRLWLQIDWTY